VRELLRQALSGIAFQVGSEIASAVASAVKARMGSDRPPCEKFEAPCPGCDGAGSVTIQRHVMPGCECGSE
jgi:hypothetical protein